MWAIILPKEDRLLLRSKLFGQIFNIISPLIIQAKTKADRGDLDSPATIPSKPPDDEGFFDIGGRVKILLEFKFMGH